MKQELRIVEQDFIDSIFDKESIEKLAQEKRIELSNKIVEFKGNTLNTMIVQNYFFKTINPLNGKEPKYCAESMSVLWEIFKDAMLDINLRIGEFAPNLTIFCNFIGIRTSTFRSYLKGSDLDLRVVCEKISDIFFDSNIGQAQIGNLKEKSTIYRMKIEQGIEEKQTPLNIHIHEKANLEDIRKRLDEIRDFNSRKSQPVIEINKNE